MKHPFFKLIGMQPLHYALVVSIISTAQRYYDEHKHENGAVDREGFIGVPLNVFRLQERAYIKDKTGSQYLQSFLWKPLPTPGQGSEHVIYELVKEVPV